MLLILLGASSASGLALRLKKMQTLPGNNPVSNKQTTARRRQQLTVAPLSVMAMGSLFFASIVMTAPPAAALDPSIYQGDYRDPLHPYCERHIRVDTIQNKWYYTGTDVGPKGWTEKHGCSKDEIAKYGLRQGAFEGQILPNGRLSVGDGIHEAMWEPAKIAATSFGYEEVDGVRFDDHNKWVRYDESFVTKESGQYVVKSKGFTYHAAETIFLAYIGFSTLAGVKGLVDAIQRKREN